MKKTLLILFIISFPIVSYGAWYSFLNPFTYFQNEAQPAPLEQKLGLATTSSYQTIIPFQDNAYDIGTSTKTWRNIFMYNSAGSTRCVQITSTGLLQIASAACGSGGGSGSGTWATTTITGSANYFNYPLNATDVVGIGSTSGTSTSKFWFDPNLSQSLITYSSSTASSFGRICLTGDLPCRTAWSLFPFTANANYVSTTTTLGLLNGFFSTASSTISSNLFLTSLSQGLLFNGTNGFTSSVATTTLTASSPLSLDNPVVKVGGSNSILSISTAGTWSGNAVTATALAANGANCSAGSYPLGVDASGAVESCTVAASGGGSDPFTHTVVGTSATTTELRFNGGFISTASSTINSSLLLPALSQGGLYTGTGGLVGTFATGTVSGTNGITVTAGRSAVGGALAIDCSVASGSVVGCLSTTDWTTFNNKQATISASFPITLTGSALSFSGLATSSALSASQVLYATGVNTIAGVATSSASCSGGASCSAFTVVGSVSPTISVFSFPWTVQTGYNSTSTVLGLNGLFSTASSTFSSALRLPSLTQGYGYIGSEGLVSTVSTSTLAGQIMNINQQRLGFSYATTTWNATTTILLGPSYRASTVNFAYCETNAGTVGVSLYDGTNRANYIPTASTTINNNGYSTNNTFTAGESMRVDLGTPASSPTRIACSIGFTVTD